MNEKESMQEASYWIPKTGLGKDVFSGKITTIDEIFNAGKKIKEPEIVDALLKNLKSELIYIGGSPGKGGGIKRTSTQRTARMHRSGRRYKISALVVVGNKDGYLGVGIGNAKEHRNAIEKATSNAKLNIITVLRGCGSWECACEEKHSIQRQIKGKAGSISVVLKPAPKGIGLCCSDEIKKLLILAGIKDIWTKTYGETRTRRNLILATFNAFKRLNKMKI